MPTNSPVNGLLFSTCKSICCYLPRKPRLQNWSKFILQVSRHVADSAEVRCVVYKCSDKFLPSAPPLAFICSIACRSPIFILRAPKLRSGSGFVKQSTMFTSVLIFGLRASSLSRVPRCDDSTPQYASSSRGRRDCWWGVLRFVSRNRWLVLVGRLSL